MPKAPKFHINSSYYQRTVIAVGSATRSDGIHYRTVTYKCSCGTVRTIPMTDFDKGKSCGCSKTSEFLSKIATRHGHTTKGKHSRTYRCWTAMMGRCYRKKDASYFRYGAKGIRICPEWHQFTGFLQDMGLAPTDKHTIDRIDATANYIKSNCRWATMREQSQNRKTTRWITYQNTTDCIAGWARRLGISAQSILTGLKRHQSFEKYMKARSKFYAVKQ